MAHIPVYCSTFTPIEHMPKPYGAFIHWEIGQRVLVVSTQGRPDAEAEVLTETREHADAPLIPGARGEGRWVREMRIDGGEYAISEAQIHFLPAQAEALSRDYESIAAR